MFLKLRTAQMLAEDMDILPIIGHDYFNELKTQIATDSLSDENKAFLPYIQKAVAYCSIVRGAIIYW